MNNSLETDKKPDPQLSERGLLRLLAAMLERELADNRRLRTTIDKMKMADVYRLTKGGV